MIKLYHKSLDNYKLPARSLGPCLVSNALIPVSASSGLWHQNQIVSELQSPLGLNIFCNLKKSIFVNTKKFRLG